MENDPIMKTLALLTTLLLAGLFVQSGQAVAAPASTSGHSALALAALVASHSPHLTRSERQVMARLFDGDLNISFPAGRTLSVRADAVACQAGDVDITAFACTLTFGEQRVSLKGRKAHELFATLAEAGAPSDGAAGTIHEGLSHLACTIDPNVIKQRAGGGAACSFVPGAP
jgi:hypothetical protein